MSTSETVAGFELRILAEIDSIQDPATTRTIYELMEYARKKEKEAENRGLRPRPDGGESIDYYRDTLNFGLIPSPTLRAAIQELLDFVAELENWLANEN